MNLRKAFKTVSKNLAHRAVDIICDPVATINVSGGITGLVVSGYCVHDAITKNSDPDVAAIAIMVSGSLAVLGAGFFPCIDIREAFQKRPASTPHP